MWRRYSLMAGWVVVVAAWLAVSGALLLKVPLTGSDFSVYLAAAQSLRFDPHANIYSEPAIVAAATTYGGCPMWGLPYLYQPLLALLLEPLAAIPCASAWYVWQGLNLALWAACIVALARYASRVGPWLALVVAALMVAFLPVLQGLLIGQIHVIILAICLGGAALVRHKHPYLAGALLGFGAVIKYFPAVLVLYYLLRGKWRVALGAAVAVAVLSGAELLVVGPHTLMLSLVGVHYAATQEASEGGAIGSLALAVLAGVAFVAATLWTTWRRTGDDEIGAAWAIASILVLSPLVQWPYLAWLLPAFAVCLCAALDEQRPRADWLRWGALAVAGIAYLLILSRQVLVHAPNSAQLIALTSGVGTVLVWCLCGLYYLRSAGAKLPIARTPSRQPLAEVRETVPAPIRP